MSFHGVEVRYFSGDYVHPRNPLTSGNHYCVIRYLNLQNIRSTKETFLQHFQKFKNFRLKNHIERMYPCSRWYGSLKVTVCRFS